MEKFPNGLKPDFGGWATKNNVKCTDGRTILPDAFSHQDGMIVPLVWQHLHNEPTNVLGHALLQNRPEGVYTYGFLNDTEAGKNAKLIVEHKDIQSLSIYANGLVEKSKNVSHGQIREVSLVLSRANPGATIDYINVQHADGSVTVLEDEAFIEMGIALERPQTNEEAEQTLEELAQEILSHADEESKETLGDIIGTMSEKQLEAFYAVIANLMDGELEQSAIEDEENSDEGDDKTIMKNNVFDGSAVQTGNAVPRLAHSDFQTIMQDARSRGIKLSKAFEESEAGQEFLAHAGTYGIGLPDHDNTEFLFPDARSITREPTFIARRMEWVSKVMKGTRHTPFSRIKSLHADITPDEARARGYVTGNLKVEEVFGLLRRITTPHTIYKKQKMDRDDILDITDFDVVRWLKGEMRVMLDEEIARAILIGDGRDPVTQVDDHIPTDNVRPIWGDAAVYAYHKQVASTQGVDDLIDDLITARDEYRGSGNPDLFVPPTFLTQMRLLKDGDGRRLYRSVAELAEELEVNSIITVPVMENQTRTDTVDYNLMAIMVNLYDYTIGADKGGQINFFQDFDIDYNQEKYLYETRISGALWVPKSAIILEQAVV